MCLLRDVRLLILEHSRWSTIQKYQAVLDGLSVDELMEFVSSFKSELYAEGLVQGNFTSSVSFYTFYIHPSEKKTFTKMCLKYIYFIISILQINIFTDISLEIY